LRVPFEEGNEEHSREFSLELFPAKKFEDMEKVPEESSSLKWIFLAC